MWIIYGTLQKLFLSNEVARLGLSENINPSAIMECFIQDKKLNISKNI